MPQNTTRRPGATRSGTAVPRAASSWARVGFHGVVLPGNTPPTLPDTHIRASQPHCDNAPASTRPTILPVMGQGLKVLRSRLHVVLAWRDTRMLCLIFLISQMLDVLTTHNALLTRRFQEGNPWLADVTNSHPFFVYGAKLALPAAVLCGLLLLRLRWPLPLAGLT